jgi:hypothetical protein
MTLSNFVLWALFLLLQNASFTFVSRARNSASYALHAAAAVCSNGVFFMTQFVTFGIIVDLLKSGSMTQRIAVGTFYTVFTVLGSVGMHWLAKKYEKGKLKVGA